MKTSKLKTSIKFKLVSYLGKKLGKYQKQVLKECVLSNEGLSVNQQNDNESSLLEEIGCDIRALQKYQLIAYCNWKLKLLDFGVLFDQELYESNLEDDLTTEGPTGFTDEQWKHLRENLFADEEYVYLDNFVRLTLFNFISEYPEVYGNITPLQLEV